MISVEAIEAVATRLYPGWQNSPADWQDYFRRKATEALEAAAPHLMASAVAYLDEAVRMISTDPDASDYERGFDDATRGMAAKTKRLLEGKEQ